MTNFHVAVQDSQVREVVGYYTHGLGAGGELFDGEGTERPTSHWDSYDITAIMQGGDKILLPALLCLMQQFEREETGAPMLQLIDEGWNAIQHPVWRPHLHRALKTKRSKNAGIGLATQNLGDVANKAFDARSQSTFSRSTVRSPKLKPRGIVHAVRHGDKQPISISPTAAPQPDKIDMLARGVPPFAIPHMRGKAEAIRPK